MIDDLEDQVWEALLGIAAILTLVSVGQAVLDGDLSLVAAWGFVVLTAAGAWVAYRYGQAWRARFEV